jgi:plastocyanin
MKHRSSLAASLIALSVSLGIMTGCETLPGVKDGVSLSPDRGALKVGIKGDFSRLRAVQAKIEDIDHVTIGVEATGVANQSQTLTRAQLADAGAAAGATFNALPAGGATASVNVYDAANEVIGSASGTATIVNGQTSTVDLTVQLVPTYVYASPAPGSLAANVTILDGPTITITPTPAPTPTQTPVPSPTPTQAAWSASVDFLSYNIQPAEVTIKQGGTVTFYNKNPNMHHQLSYHWTYSDLVNNTKRTTTINIGSQQSVTYSDVGRYPFTVSYSSTAYAGAVNVVQ